MSEEQKQEQHEEKKNWTQDHQEQKPEKREEKQAQTPIQEGQKVEHDPTVPAHNIAPQYTQPLPDSVKPVAPAVQPTGPLVVINHKHSYTGTAIVIAILAVAAYLHFVAGVF